MGSAIIALENITLTSVGGASYEAPIDALRLIMCRLCTDAAVPDSVLPVSRTPLVSVATYNIDLTCTMFLIQHTQPNSLQSIKVAAGKSGTEGSKADAREWARARIREDLVITRGILVQAGQLGILLSRFYELYRQIQLARLTKLQFADRDDVDI